MAGEMSAAERGFLDGAGVGSLAAEIRLARRALWRLQGLALSAGDAALAACVAGDMGKPEGRAAPPFFEALAKWLDLLRRLELAQAKLCAGVGAEEDDDGFDFGGGEPDEAGPGSPVF